MRPVAVPISVALLAAAVPAAAAQVPVTPPRPQQPVAGSMRLSYDGLSRVSGRVVAVAGQGWRVRGTVRPFVPNQFVVVRVTRSGRRLATLGVPVRPGARGEGTFSVLFRGSRPGRVRVVAEHVRSAQQARLRADGAPVDVVSPSAGRGAGGMKVRYLQAKLAQLGYMVPRHGRFDDATARAVIAFRKVNRMPRVGFANSVMYYRLARGRGALRVRYPNHGHHIEISRNRQVMALIEGDRVYKVFHVSTGAASTPTPLGSFRVFSKTAGYNALGMLHANYFAAGGYATHGYHTVPNYPASHGCVRTPIANARFIYNWARYGTRVDIYR